MVPESYYVALSAVLFSMGVLGVLVRRNLHLIPSPKLFMADQRWPRKPAAGRL